MVNRVDSLGLLLWGCSKQRTCDDVCANALKDPSISKSDGGGVICDGNRKCPCFFGLPGAKPGDCPGLEKIVKDHEKEHFGDVDCDSKKGLHRPPFKLGVDQTASECSHRKQSIKDLDAAILGASGQCKKAMEDAKNGLQSWVSANCGP